MSISQQPSEASAVSDVELTPEEAFAGIMLAAVAVDGHMAEVELQNLTITLKRSKLYRQQASENIVATLKKLLNIIKSKGIDTLVQSSVAQLPKHLSATVFAIATDITLADGAMFNEELEILSQLAESLSIPEDTVNQITQVMMIKNRG